MIRGLEAGIGPKQIMRVLQWMIGVPIIWSFALAMAGLNWTDPALLLMQTMITSEWWARVALGGIALMIEFSDFLMKKSQHDYEQRVHEILKAIGDRLRSGSAVETAVAEACRTTDGPSDVFEHAIELADEMSFYDALKVAADECGSEYLREVCYLVAEAVQSEGDTGSAIRRLGLELERNHQYATTVQAKIANPLMVMRVVGLVAVPPLYSLLTYSFNNYETSRHEAVKEMSHHPAALAFFGYVALVISMYDGLIFGEWERVPVRLPLALASVYLGLHILL